MLKKIKVLIPLLILIPTGIHSQGYYYAAAAAAGGYSPNATTFAGDNQCHMERDADLDGNSDGKSFTVSVWLDFSGGDASARRIFQNENGRIRMTREGGNTMRITCENSSGTTLVDLETAGGLNAAGGWYHVMISVDKAVETRRHMYINGVSDIGSVHTFLSDDEDGNSTSIDFTQGDWAVGDFVGGGAGSMIGCMSEFYFSKTYVDLSVAGNRDIFYHVDGPPGDLSAVNSPMMYFKNAFGTHTVNSGSGGNFTKKGTTAFTTCTAP